MLSLSTGFFSEDESKIAIATEKGCSAIVNRVANAVHVHQFNEKACRLSFIGRDGAKIVEALGSRVVIFNADGVEPHAELPMKNPERVLALGYSAQHSAIIAITQDARVHSWRLGEEKIDLGVGETKNIRLRNAYINEAGTSAIVELEDGTIESWDLQSRAQEPVLAFPGETRLIDVGFDRIGKSTLLASDDNVVRI